jgi:hypothetical protein
MIQKTDTRSSVPLEAGNHAEDEEEDVGEEEAGEECAEVGE